MRRKIIIATSKTVVNTLEGELEYPETPVYYQLFDHGAWFARGEIVFAIIPYANGFRLLQVERNKQDFNDFVPHSDCKEEYWLRESGIRKVAFEIMSTKATDWEQIDEATFNDRRQVLLNAYAE